MSGKRKQNTIKTTTFCDAQGRTLFSGVARPGRMHDQTAVRSEGIAEQFRLRPMVRAEVDEGYRGLANECPNGVSAPPKKVKPDVPLGDQYAWRHFRPKGSGGTALLLTYDEQLCSSSAESYFVARPWGAGCGRQ